MNLKVLPPETNAVLSPVKSHAESDRNSRTGEKGKHPLQKTSIK